MASRGRIFLRWGFWLSDAALRRPVLEVEIFY
jgi:hypothetical protein